MLYRIAGMLLLGATALANSVAAQSPPTPAAITRTVVAATKLPTVTEVPLYFRAVSVTLPPGETSSVSAANGILYQMSGSTMIGADDQARTLNPGEGSFIAAGKQVMLDSRWRLSAAIGKCGRLPASHCGGEGLDQTACLSRLAVAERRMLITLPGLTLNLRAVDLSPAPRARYAWI